MLGIEEINLFIFRAINSLAGASGLLDALAVFFAKYLVAFFLFLPFCFWFWRKKRYRELALLSLSSGALGIVVSFLLRFFYFHPRPFMLGIGKAIISHSATSSFPSGHTTLMLSIAFSLLYFKKSRLAGIILSPFGVLGGLARVFCGVHFPLDILGSIVVAALSSLAAYSLRKGIKKFSPFIAPSS